MQRFATLEQPLFTNMQCFAALASTYRPYAAVGAIARDHAALQHLGIGQLYPSLLMLGMSPYRPICGARSLIRYEHEKVCVCVCKGGREGGREGWERKTGGVGEREREPGRNLEEKECESERARDRERERERDPFSPLPSATRIALVQNVPGAVATRVGPAPGCGPMRSFGTAPLSVIIQSKT